MSKNYPYLCGFYQGTIKIVLRKIEYLREYNEVSKLGDAESGRLLLDIKETLELAKWKEE